MTVEYIRYKVTNRERDSFMESYKIVSAQLDITEHCKAYELSECAEEVNQFILRIEWASSDENLNGFAKNKSFSALSDNVNPFSDYVQEMRHYKLTEVANRKEIKSETNTAE